MSERTTGALVPAYHKVLREVAGERARQTDKWGEQNHPDGTGPNRRILRHSGLNLDLRTGAELAEIFKAKCGRNLPREDNWLDILLEEVFEAAAEEETDKLRTELIQVAAVAAAWVEAIDRRTE